MQMRKNARFWRFFGSRNTIYSSCNVHPGRSVMLTRAVLLGFVLGALLLGPLSAQAQSVYYVRAGATGAKNGTDWNNAYTSLPSTLVRGATYYIADGTYPGYKFDDPVDGTKLITIKKATASDHGTETGWNSSYGDGVAEFNTYTDLGNILTFLTDYYVFDGVTGGGPGSWTTGHGFKLSNADNIYFVMFSNKWGAPSQRVNVNYITIRHVELAGKAPVTPGYQLGFDASAEGAYYSNIEISHVYTHDIGMAHFLWQNSSYITVQYSYITRNATSDTHHGTGFRMDNCSNITFRYNLMSDITGTGFVGAYEFTIQNVSIYGNVFYHTSGFSGDYGNGVIYSVGSGNPTLINWNIQNNSFVELNSSATICFYAAGTNLTAYNNMFYNIYNNPSFQYVTHDYSWFYPSFSHGESNGQVGSGNPFIDWQNDNFHLVSATNAGKTLSSPFNGDPDGKTRGLDGVWDRGAYEYVSGQPDTTPPSLPSGIHIISP